MGLSAVDSRISSSCAFFRFLVCFVTLSDISCSRFRPPVPFDERSERRGGGSFSAEIRYFTLQPLVRVYKTDLYHENLLYLLLKLGVKRHPEP